MLDNVQLLPTTIKEVALAYNWDVKFLNLAVKLLKNYTTAKADGDEPQVPEDVPKAKFKNIAKKIQKDKKDKKKKKKKPKE